MLERPNHKRGSQPVVPKKRGLPGDGGSPLYTQTPAALRGVGMKRPNPQTHQPSFGFGKMKGPPDCNSSDPAASTSGDGGWAKRPDYKRATVNNSSAHFQRAFKKDAKFRLRNTATAVATNLWAARDEAAF